MRNLQNGIASIGCAPLISEIEKVCIWRFIVVTILQNNFTNHSASSEAADAATRWTKRCGGCGFWCSTIQDLIMPSRYPCDDSRLNCSPQLTRDLGILRYLAFTNGICFFWNNRSGIFRDGNGRTTRTSYNLHTLNVHLVFLSGGSTLCIHSVLNEFSYILAMLYKKTFQIDS